MLIMRDKFFNVLCECAHFDRNIILVTGDLGFGVLDQFISNVPLQFINAGVAEQNMTGMAVGLALEGKIVFTYSIANFPTFRCLEQIRNDVLYHNACVNIVAVGGGLSYGALGMSHHAIEDIAVIGALPGIRVFAPCDDVETNAIVRYMISDPAPTYLRIDKSKVSDGASEPPIPGQLRRLRFGSNVAIIGYGGIVVEALRAAAILEREGIFCSVYSSHTLKPFDRCGLIEIVRTHDALITIEEHVPSGGLGSIVSDIFSSEGEYPKRMLKMCPPDKYSSTVGSQEYLRHCYSLDSVSIVENCRKLIKRNP